MIGAALRAALGVAGAGEAVPAAPLFDYLATVLLDDPVALWMLDGDATDELGAHDGSAAGGLDYALAPWGTQSARIDDDAERINVASVPLSASNPRPFTVELWIKPTARPSLAGIMLMQTNSAGSNDNIGLRLESGGGGALEEATAGRGDVGHGGLQFLDQGRLWNTKRPAASCSGSLRKHFLVQPALLRRQEELGRPEAVRRAGWQGYRRSALG
jgi:hypothetical protein